MAGFGNLLQLLGGIQPGYNSAQADQMKLQQMKDQAAGRNIYGNALGDIYSGGGGAAPMPQSPAPGQPSVPMARPVPGGQPGMQGSPGAQPIQQPQQQGLDWKQIVTSIKQKNPDISGAQLAAAVDQFQPLMNMQSKQQWQILQAQIKEQQLGERERHDKVIEGTGAKNADTKAAWEAYREANPTGATKSIDAQDKVIANKLKEITGKNGGMIPPNGTPDGKAYNELLKQRTALAQKKVQLIDGAEQNESDDKESAPISYKSPDDVAAAYAGGTLTKEEATKILNSMGYE